MTTATELRFAFTFDDYESALRLFRDVLGLPMIKDLDHQGGRGVILHVPSATLELFDAEHADFVDTVEVGRPVSRAPRIAIRINDLTTAAEHVTNAGATPVADAVRTPWGDHNQRFATRDGLQLTLFQSP